MLHEHARVAVLARVGDVELESHAAELVGTHAAEGDPEWRLGAAIVARATNKIDKSEAEVLKAIGRAASVPNDQVAAIAKRATGLL